MKRFCSIISCFLAITILISSSMVTAHATSTNPFTGSFWNWLLEGAQNEQGGSDVGFSDYLKACFSRTDSGCTKSSDGYHKWNCVADHISVIVNQYRVVCSYCGMYYSDYSSCDPEREAETAYSDYVFTLPSTGYTNSGRLIWQPRWIEDTSLWDLKCYYWNSSRDTMYCFIEDGIFTSNGYGSATVNGSSISWNVNFSDIKDGVLSRVYFTNHSFSAPIDGSYRVLSSNAVSSVGSYINGTSISSVSKDWSSANVGVFIAGNSISLKGLFPNSSGWLLDFYHLRKGTFIINSPIFEITPVNTSLIPNNYYISTRVNNFNGDYYDSVTNNYYNNTTIVNETTNNYYDMTTNNNYTMSSWSYDYVSRTYFITLEDGTTVTVQFGDDCMTITKNDVTNSYQYVIKNNSTPDTPTTCKHDWQETIDTAPTCLEGGHASYTCSLCGETYEQILSAKGHSWTVAEHVNTVYGENGEVVTQGHTLYQCSVCGEQWYTDSGAPPPDVSGSNTIIAWLTNFQTWLDGKFGLFVDKLQVVVDNSETNIENVTNVVIEETNNAYNVFYVTTEDGDKKPVGEVAGDTLSASGKLLNFLYKLCFEGALSKVDDSISDMDGFYFDSGTGMEGNIWD